jgi:hypothetical protein
VILLKVAGTKSICNGRATDLWQKDFVMQKRNFQRPCFVEVFACAAWNIWKSRNDFIFQAIPFSIDRWKVGFRSDLWLHHYRVKQALVQPLLDWLLDNL